MLNCQNGFFFVLKQGEGRRMEIEINLLNLLYLNPARTYAMNRWENGFILLLFSADILCYPQRMILAPLGVPRALPRDLREKNYLCNYTKIVLPFLLYWPLALVMPECWWVKSLVPLQDSRQWHQLGLGVLDLVLLWTCYWQNITRFS